MPHKRSDRSLSSQAQGPASYFPSWHGIGCNCPASPSVDVNFFQRHWATQADEIEPPAVEPPPLQKEEKNGPTNTIQPIHLDDAQYLQLTRALRPSAAPVLIDLPIDNPGPNIPTVPGEAGQSPPLEPPSASPEQPSDAPIV